MLGHHLSRRRYQPLAAADRHAATQDDQIGQVDRREVAQALAKIIGHLGPLVVLQLLGRLAVDPPDAIARYQRLQAIRRTTLAAYALGVRAAEMNRLVPDLGVRSAHATVDVAIHQVAAAHTRAQSDIQEAPACDRARGVLARGRDIGVHIDREAAAPALLHE